MPKTERQTKQKKIVEEYLASTYSHPSAEKIYKKAKKKLPRISKATVYRILRNFRSKGKIQEIPTDISRWDYNEDPHPHFLCKECGNLYDIEEDIDLPQKKSFEVGEAKNFKIIFSGICKNCKQKVD